MWHEIIKCLLAVFQTFKKPQQEKYPEPFPIVIVEFPKQYGESIHKMIFKDTGPRLKSFCKYPLLAKKIKSRVCADPKLYELPDVGKQRIIGWALNGKKIYDVIEMISTYNYGRTFAGSEHAEKINKANGFIMAWLSRSYSFTSYCGLKEDIKEGMFIWPVSLVIHKNSVQFFELAGF